MPGLTCWGKQLLGGEAKLGERAKWETSGWHDG